MTSVPHIPPSLSNTVPVFLSIVIESLPFILIGIFISSVIAVFVSDDTVRRLVPSNRVGRLVVAGLIGLIFPMCECGIIPIARRLVAKGIPMSFALTFMLATPIMNPVSISSTVVAFSGNPHVAITRVLWGFVVAVAVGFAWSLAMEFDSVNGADVDGHCGCSSGCGCTGGTDGIPRVLQLLRHIGAEFLDVYKYVVLGAGAAAIAQGALPRQALIDVGQGPISSVLVMMSFAFVISLCSEADAFVASSFASSFSPQSLIAFLVLGPMLDLKNTLLLFSTFQPKTVIFIALSVVISVAILAVLFGDVVQPIV